MAIKKTEYLKFGENLYEIIPPLPSGTDRGGIIASPKESTDTVEVKLGGDGKLYVPTYPPSSSADVSGVQAQIDALQDIVNDKADTDHTHIISNITNLQNALDEKVSTTRMINGKALYTDVTLSASDVGADVSGAAASALTSANAYTDSKAVAIQFITWGADD